MSSETYVSENAFYRPRVQHRAAQAGVDERRHAKAVTNDIGRRLTRWHIEIAQLRGLVEYRRSRGSDHGLTTRIDALAGEIKEHRTIFREMVATLPLNVASSGWITDIDRVLCRASEMVEAMRTADALAMP